MSRNASLGVHSPLINGDVLQTLEDEGADPIRYMAKIVNGDEPASPEIRFAAAKELAMYVHPKKKALDLRMQGKVAVTYNVVQFSQVMPDEAQALADQTRAMLDNRPRTRAEVRQIERSTAVNSAALVEAMRRDVEGLVVDANGLVDE
jgi:hypothetical protein